MTVPAHLMAKNHSLKSTATFGNFVNYTKEQFTAWQKMPQLHTCGWKLRMHTLPLLTTSRIALILVPNRCFSCSPYSTNCPLSMYVWNWLLVMKRYSRSSTSSSRLGRLVSTRFIKRRHFTQHWQQIQQLTNTSLLSCTCSYTNNTHLIASFPVHLGKEAPLWILIKQTRSWRKPVGECLCLSMQVHICLPGQRHSPTALRRLLVYFIMYTMYTCTDKLKG